MSREELTMMGEEKIDDMHTLERGTLYKSPPGGHHYSSYETYVHDDGWLKFTPRSDSPSRDSDNDIKVRFYNEVGEKTGSGYIDADHVYATGKEVSDLEPGGPEPERTLEEKLDTDISDEDTIAVLEEEQENLVQMQQIRAYTIAPGLLQLPVIQVTSAENSQQWAILVDHPVLGELRFYREKPITGWTDEYDIVGLMESYGIHDGNPYKLQGTHVYVEFTGNNPELSEHWELKRRDEVIDENGAIDAATDGGGDDPSHAPPPTGGGEVEFDLPGGMTGRAIENLGEFARDTATVTKWALILYSWPIAGLQVFPELHEEQYSSEPEPIDWAIIYGICGCGCWMLLWFFTALVAGAI